MECYCLQASDVYPIGLNDDEQVRHCGTVKNLFIEFARQKLGARDLLQRIYYEYSKKQLTFRSDKLAALSGVLRTVSHPVDDASRRRIRRRSAKVMALAKHVMVARRK